MLLTLKQEDQTHPSKSMTFHEHFGENNHNNGGRGEERRLLGECARDEREQGEVEEGGFCIVHTSLPDH